MKKKNFWQSIKSSYYSWMVIIGIIASSLMIFRLYAIFLEVGIAEFIRPIIVWYDSNISIPLYGIVTRFFGEYKIFFSRTHLDFVTLYLTFGVILMRPLFVSFFYSGKLIGSEGIIGILVSWPVMLLGLIAFGFGTLLIKLIAFDRKISRKKYFRKFSLRWVYLAVLSKFQLPIRRRVKRFAYLAFLITFFLISIPFILLLIINLALQPLIWPLWFTYLYLNPYIMAGEKGGLYFTSKGDDIPDNYFGTFYFGNYRIMVVAQVIGVAGAVLVWTFLNILLERYA